MTAILYPVAETAEAALHAPLGFAARTREAQGVATGGVSFVTETVGPAFPTREAAAAAYGDAPEDGHWRELTPVSISAPSGKAAKPVPPIYRDGRRWPEPKAALTVLWRMSVSYWRVGEATGEPVGAPARRLRRGSGGRELKAPALNALARQPLRPFAPQQPLDIGLFEVRPPDAPDLIIPDE